MTAIAALEPVVVNVSLKTNWSFRIGTTSDGAVGCGECSLQCLGAAAGRAGLANSAFAVPWFRVLARIAPWRRRTVINLWRPAPISTRG